MIADIKNDSLRKLAQLLSNKSVQDELSLTSDQETDLRAALGDIRQKLTGEMEKHLSEILIQEQQKRFKEIRVQVQGLNAFGVPEAQSQLQLNDNQREQILAI